MNDNCKLAFVLPRSFFSADHHDNTRSGKAKGFKVALIWDLDKVNPLFRVPSCVFFVEKHKKDKSIQVNNLDGKIFSGKLPEHNCNLKIASDLITENDVKYFYIKQGNASAISTRKAKSNQLENPYKKNFKQGATIVPRCFYFVELNQEIPPDFNDRILNIKTSEAIEADAKKPWKGLKFNGKIESKFLFRTALAKSILPFALYNPDLVVLPVLIETDHSNNKKIKLLESDELRREGYLNAARWFKNVENTWQLLRTEKNQNISSVNYLNWQNKLTSQKLEAKYLVTYNMSGKDAYATVIKRSEIDFDFIVDYTTFRIELFNEKEAYYLESILNSTAPNLLMKDFQAKGLFGARHVSKKILDIYFPRYDDTNETHRQLAELGREAHQRAKEFLEKNPPQKELSATRLGRLRMEIKKHLAKEMQEIDKLIEKILR